MEKLFGLFGFENAADKAQTVLRLETRLAKAAFNNVQLRDPQANYNKMSVDELQQLVPQVDWKVYFEAAGIKDLDSLSIGQIPHLQEAGRMLAEEPLACTLWFSSGLSGTLRVVRKRFANALP